jgi:hypothetical protein
MRLADMSLPASLFLSVILAIVTSGAGYSLYSLYHLVLPMHGGH